MEQIDGPAGSDEYRSALCTTRCAKNVFWGLILLSLAVQFSGFVLARFTSVLSEGREQVATQQPKAPATQPAGRAEEPKAEETKAEETSAAGSKTWKAVYGWLLPATKFTALAAGMLLVLTVLLSVKLALIGRTGGVHHLLRAFFCALVLWVFLIPWQQVLAGSSVVCGALYNLGDLTAATGEVTTGQAGWSGQVVYYLRFVAYPALVVLLSVIVHIRFSRGYRQACLNVQPVAVDEPGGREGPKI